MSNNKLFMIGLQEIEQNPEILAEIIVNKLNEKDVLFLRIERDLNTRSLIIIKKNHEDGFNLTIPK